MKVYRDRVDVDQIVKDASSDRRVSERAARPSAAVSGHVLFRTAAAQLPAVRPRASRSGTRGCRGDGVRARGAGEPGRLDAVSSGHAAREKRGDRRARAAFERALALQPDLAEANNDLGALLAQGGDLDGAIGRFRAALASTPDYPDALNNLGYALLLTGRDEEARALYEKALALQPDFPEALNNLGLLLGRAGDMDRAERYFREALGRRPDYGEAANNLALVLVSKRASGRGRRPSAGRAEANAGVRGRLRDARKDPLQRRSHQRGDRDAGIGCCSGIQKTRSHWSCFGN